MSDEQPWVMSWVFKMVHTENYYKYDLNAELIARNFFDFWGTLLALPMLAAAEQEHQNRVLRELNSLVSGGVAAKWCSWRRRSPAPSGSFLCP